MSLLSALMEPRALTAKDPALKAMLESWGGGQTVSGAHITPENSLKISGWYAGVRILSETLASLPMITYRRTAKGRERAVDHPIYRLLHDKPNPFMTAVEFYEASNGHLITWGNSFAVLERVNGRVTAIWPLTPDKIRIQIFNGRLWYYYQQNQGGELQIPQENMLHVRALSSDGLLGYSPVDLMRETLGLAKTEEEYRARFFKNDARPGGIIEYPQGLSDQAYQRYKTDWENTYSGLGNKFRLAFLEGGLKYHDVGFPPEAAQFIEGRKFQIEEIARILGIPLILLQSTEKATSWGCLPGDTLIFTDHGPKPIIDVRAGDCVWSLGKEGMVCAKVIAQQMTGIRNFLTIETVGRTIRPTGNHRMLVRRYRKVGKGKKTLGWETLWLSADQVKVGDYLPIPHGLKGCNGDRAPDGRLLTVGAMEFCGLFTGDGNVDGPGRIEIAHEINPLHMVHYDKVIAKEFNGSPRRDGRGTRTRFSSPTARELLSCGFLGSALTKRVPGWVFGLKRELQLGYLRGYLDADGSVQRGRIIYSSANALLLEDIRHLCIQAGIPVGRVCIGRQSGIRAIRGKQYNCERKYQLSLSSLRFNSEIGSNSPRKLSRFITDQPLRKFRYDRDYDSGVGGSQLRKLTEGWEFDDIKLHKVKRITESQVEVPVYDITVEGTETFVADGVLVHNTGIEQFLLGFIKFTIRPWLARWESRLNIQLFSEAEQQTYYAEALIEDLLRADSLTRAQVLQILRRNGCLSANEWRGLENMNSIPGAAGDTYIIEGNMTRLDQVGKQFDDTEPAPAMNGNGNGASRPNGAAQ